MDDLKVFKVGSVLQVDSWAAYTSVNDSTEVQNIKNVQGSRLEYADGSVRKEIKVKGNFMLNGHGIPTFVFQDLPQNLLSTPKISRY